MSVLLDAHAAIRFASEDAAQGKRRRTPSNEALAEGGLCISPISFRELALTGDVALPSATRDLHGDPADRFIAATAITHRATLLTADARLLDWKHAAKRQNARK